MERRAFACAVRYSYSGAYTVQILSTPEFSSTHSFEKDILSFSQERGCRRRSFSEDTVVQYSGTLELYYHVIFRRLNKSLIKSLKRLCPSKGCSERRLIAKETNLVWVLVVHRVSFTEASKEGIRGNKV